MKAKKNILITAANSNIAKAFLIYLKKHNLFDQYQLFGTSRGGNDLNGFQDVYKLDFASGETPIINIIFDYIFHFAAALPNQHSNMPDFMKINVEGPLNFFNTIKLNKGALFVNISSWDVYEKPNSNIVENSPKTTSSQYGISKLLFEDKITSFLTKTTMRVISIRLPCLLVPGVKGNFMAKWKSSIIKDKTIAINNPNLTSNALIDGDSIFAFALSYDGPSLSFNVGSKHPISFKNIAEILSSGHNKKLLFETSNNNGKNQTIDSSLAEKHGFISPDLEDIVTEYSHA